MNPEEISQHILTLLDEAQVEYKLFNHRLALTYEDLAAVQQETGFIGTEAKCMAMKADEASFMYITLQGNRVDISALKTVTEAKKVRLLTAEELKDEFATLPGCAYPFGFASSVNIFVDPAVFEQEWILFSPALPSQTVQARGDQLEKLFRDLPNKTAFSAYNKE